MSINRDFINLAGFPLCHVHISVFFCLNPDIQHFCEKCRHLFRYFFGYPPCCTDLIRTIFIAHPNRIRFFPDVFVFQVTDIILVILRIHFADIHQILFILHIHIRIQNLRTVLILLDITWISKIHPCSCNYHQQWLFGVCSKTKIIKLSSLVLMVFIKNQSGRIRSISILAILFRQCLYEASSFSVYYSIPGDFKKRFQWRFIQHELSFIQNNLRLIPLGSSSIIFVIFFISRSHN